ncbi:MAG TPA: NAD-dependent epimerase/dehydratase family protein [Prolixibacteraceae bacterium]
MNILITGIHGFIGSNLVAALKAHHAIYGLDIVSPQKEGIVKTFGWNELEQIPSVDLIIHLAGKAHDTIKRGRLGDEEKKGEGARERLHEGATSRIHECTMSRRGDRETTRLHEKGRLRAGEKQE